ncbi:hypothetical protein P8452_76963 [Trifolium repens]|nr:hypothetical protein P8452_76963 [Trifolium repens]
MTGASNLLGQTNASPVSDPEKSKEEEDQQERNTKKAKINNQIEGARDLILFSFILFHYVSLIIEIHWIIKYMDFILRRSLSGNINHQLHWLLKTLQVNCSNYYDRCIVVGYQPVPLVICGQNKELMKTMKDQISCAQRESIVLSSAASVCALGSVASWLFSRSGSGCSFGGFGLGFFTVALGLHYLDL